MINKTWNQLTDNWIIYTDIRYQFIQQNVVTNVFPSLNTEDTQLLTNAIVQIINFIYIKFEFKNNPSKNEDLLWHQLTQNNAMDLKAILAMTLPFINDNESNDNKNKLRKLTDIYLEKNIDPVDFILNKVV